MAAAMRSFGSWGIARIVPHIRSAIYALGLSVVLNAYALQDVAYARLGDRFNQCIAMYGSPIRVIQTSTGKWAKFFFHDVAVFASFHEDRCVEVEYLNIPGPSLKGLLAANQGFGDWSAGQLTDGGEKVFWSRTDGATAVLDLANEPNAILFRSADADKMGVKPTPWILSRPFTPLGSY